jgi:hypothetical protein
MGKRTKRQYVSEYFTSGCAILCIREKTRNLKAEAVVQRIQGLSSAMWNCRVETCKEIEVEYANGPTCVSRFAHDN